MSRKPWWIKWRAVGLSTLGSSLGEAGHLVWQKLVKWLATARFSLAFDFADGSGNLLLLMVGALMLAAA